MDIKPGDEVFVCLKWNDTSASRWDTAVVEKTTQMSIYIDYPPLLNKRIPKETMAFQGYIVSKETMASHGYIIFVPTDSDRIKRDDAIFRRGLISTLIKADWGNLKTETLVELVVKLNSAEQTPGES